MNAAELPDPQDTDPWVRTMLNIAANNTTGRDPAIRALTRTGWEPEDIATAAGIPLERVHWATLTSPENWKLT